MGFGSWFSKVIKKIGGGVKKVGSTVYHTVKKGSSSIIKSGVIQRVYKDTTSAISYVAHQPERVLNTVVKATEHNVDSVVGGAKSLGSSLSMPLTVGIIGAVAVGALVLTRK
jgi:hypothetical protein